MAKLDTVPLLPPPDEEKTKAVAVRLELEPFTGGIGVGIPKPILTKMKAPEVPTFIKGAEDLVEFLKKREERCGGAREGKKGVGYYLAI